MKLNDVITEAEKTRLDPKCWTGKKIGNPKTKVKGGVRVNNCVPAESVAEGSDPNTQSHADAFKSETDTMKPGTKKYVGRKGGKEVTAKKDEQGNVKFYHRDGIKGPLKRVNEMDSQGYKGSRDDYELGKGKEHTGKSITAKDAAKDAEKILNKSHPKTWHDVDNKLGRAVDKMSQAEKVKKGLAHPDTLKKPGVTEGSEQINELSPETLKSYANKARAQVRASPGANPNNSHLPTDPKIANRARGAVKADNRLHGFGPAKKSTQDMAEGLDQHSPVAQAITRRILMQRTDLLAKYGPGYVGQAIDDVVDSVGDVEEIGSSDVSGWVRQVEHNLKNKLNQYDEPMNVGDALDEEHNAEYDDEAGMADNNLETLSRAVEGIDELIQSGDNLPEWCQEKIAVAKSMLVAVWDYMYSEEASDEVDPEVDEMYEAMDQLAEEIAARDNIDVDLVWESFESLDDHMLYETAAWRRKEGKSKTGGLNAKGVASYRRENPGSKLQTAVTTKPSKLKPGSKAAKRRKSFCARMSGVKGPMKKPNGKPTRKALALRKWNC